MSRIVNFCLLLLAGLASVPGSAQAAVPTTLHYQGYLTSADGLPLNDIITITVSLYELEAGGAPVWSEQQMIAVNKGLFSMTRQAAISLGKGADQRRTQSADADPGAAHWPVPGTPGAAGTGC